MTVSSWNGGYLDEPANEEIVHRVEAVASKRGIKMAQVSLAWLTSKEGVAAPIVGTTSLDKLKELIGNYLLPAASLGPF